jgi:DNA primase large subunit
MTTMYERLAGEHHLKHWGLQQFSLFLKAIGLPLEQAMLFFRQQFGPRCVRVNWTCVCLSARSLGLGGGVGWPCVQQPCTCQPLSTPCRNA